MRDGDGLAGVNLVRTADELRVLDDGALVGMSYVDRPLLRRLGLPFLLVPGASASS